MSTSISHPTGVKLDINIKKRLQQLGELKHRTPHWLMKEAISQYIAREEKAEQLKKETLARWKEVTQGKTVNHADVLAWLETWGKVDETERPKCKK